MSRLRAVLFDYGHTLIYFAERPHERLVDAYQRINHLLAETLSREVPTADVLIEKVSQAVDAEIQRDYAAGRPEELEIAAVYDRALRSLGLELDPQVVERVMELEQQGWLDSVHVGPYVVSTLEWLRARGLRLGIVSNAAYLPRLMEAQVSALGLKPYFAGMTFSSAVGLRKPHRAIYEDALAKLGVAPDEAAFVGDRVREDVQGPKSLGMRGILVREWRQEEDPGVADAVIANLGELPAAIEPWLADSAPAGTYNEVTSRE